MFSSYFFRFEVLFCFQAGLSDSLLSLASFVIVGMWIVGHTADFASTFTTYVAYSPTVVYLLLLAVPLFYHY